MDKRPRKKPRLDGDSSSPSKEYAVHAQDRDDDDASSASDGSEDIEVQDILVEDAAQKHKTKTDPRSRSFVKETIGDPYLHGIAKAARTSNNRLSTEFEAPFSQDSYRAALQRFDNADESHLPQMYEDIERAYDSRFRLWEFELRQGFSTLFHGYGSKRKLLNSFARKQLARSGDVIVVDGFAPGVGISDIVTALEEHLPANTTSAKKSGHAVAVTTLDKTERRAAEICERLSKAHRPIYLLIHNIETPGLSSAKSKNVLAMLSAQPKLHLVASVDHIRSMLLFPTALAKSMGNAEDEESRSSASRGFSFIHHHTPTYRPYTEETLSTGLPSLLFPPAVFPSLTTLLSANGSANAKMQGVQSVLASLNDNSSKLFKALAEQQLAAYRNLDAEQARSVDVSSETTPSVAVRVAVLFPIVRDMFLATNETQMQALLSEFRDHGIVDSSHDAPENLDLADDDGLSDWLWIKLDKKALEGIVEWMA